MPSEQPKENQEQQIQAKDLFEEIGELYHANRTLAEKTMRLKAMCSALEKENKELKGKPEN